MRKAFSGGAYALLLVSVGALGVVSYVHYLQVKEKKEMHQGVINDIERLRRKRKLNGDQ